MASATRPEEETVEQLLARVIPASGERLTLQGELASGGMASIFRGIDRCLERRVAVKMMHNDRQHSTLAVRSFIREAQITGQLDHPNIVPVHDLNIDEHGSLYFVMKMVEGRTLHDLIDAVRATHDRVDERGLKLATALAHGDLLRLLDVFF